MQIFLKTGFLNVYRNPSGSGAWGKSVEIPRFKVE
jgi:hypothetical protein